MSRKTDLIYQLRSEKTSLKTIIASVVVAAIGLVLLYIANVNTPGSFWGEESLKNFTRDFGSLLVVSVALTLLWELSGKRSFVDELYSKADIAQTIQSSGLIEIVFHNEDIDWETLFKTAHEVDLFFAYNSQWRTTNEVRLKELASRKGAKVRLILPDLSNEAIVTDLAKRFDKSPERLKTKIEEAKEQFLRISQECGPDGATIEIYYYCLSPHYSFYRFDTTYIVALYTQQTEKVYVPHFVFRKGGELAEFLDSEIRGLTSGKYSRKIQ